MFKANVYPGRFFDNLVQQFHCLNSSNQSSVNTDQTSIKSTHDAAFISYFRRESRRFVHEFSKIIRNQLNVKIIQIYISFKVKSYFQLKSRILVALCSKFYLSFHMFVRHEQDIHWYVLQTRRVAKNSQWGDCFGVWGWSPQPPEANGGMGAKPLAAGRQWGVWKKSPQRSKILHFLAKLT